MSNAICVFEGCGVHRYSKESKLCDAHHAQLVAGKVLTPRKGTAYPECLSEDCTALAQPKGYCRKHYFQFYSTGRTWGPGSPHSCEVQDCGRPVARRLLCESHAKYGPEHRIRGTRVKCEVSYCERMAQGRMCPKHNIRISRFGLSPDRVIEMLSLPGCEACQQPGEDLHFHHDHSCCPSAGRSCGKCIVAYLCGPCNTSAGMVGDSAERLRALADIIDQGPRRWES